MRRRKLIEERIFRFLSALAAWSLLALLALIIVVIFIHGFRALNLDMITKLPKGGFYYGGEGGVLNAIVGSLYIAFGGTILAMALGIPAALYVNVHLVRYTRTQNFIRYLLDALWGIPSIVYGAFGFTLMLMAGMNASLLAGTITVALLVTPIMARTFDEVLSTIPKGLHEASLALGSSNAQTAFRVIFRQGLPGFVTAVLLSFGRAIGDAASVLFTAGYTDRIPVNLDEPAATLPLAIFFQLGSPIPEVRQRAFASAVILTIIILILSLSARFIAGKLSRSNLR
jgi:phosphate transport system permease protein